MQLKAHKQKSIIQIIDILFHASQVNIDIHDKLNTKSDKKTFKQKKINACYLKCIFSVSPTSC